MIKRVMFIVAMALIMSFEPAQGSPFCVDYAYMSEQIMKARQEGYPKGDTLTAMFKAGTSNQIMELAVKTVEAAYRDDIRSTDKARRRAVGDFMTIMMINCENAGL